MKYLKQFVIILAFSAVGEVLHSLIPLPIPASIYGIILLFLSLEFHLIRVSQIKETSSFLIEIMPVMFIPAAVGLIDSWSLLKNDLAAYLVIVISTTVVVMAVSGRITQAIIRRKEASHE